VSAKRTARTEQRARETARSHRQAPLVAPGRRGYSAITISLYTDELLFVERLVLQLEAAGDPKASRSRVLQEAVAQLRAVLEARGLEDGADLLQFFRDEAVARRQRPPLRGTS